MRIVSDVKEITDPKDKEKVKIAGTGTVLMYESKTDKWEELEDLT